MLLNYIVIDTNMNLIIISMSRINRLLIIILIIIIIYHSLQGYLLNV